MFQTSDCGSVNSATGRPLKPTDVACMLKFDIVDKPLTLEQIEERSN